MVKVLIYIHTLTTLYPLIDHSLSTLWSPFDLSLSRFKEWLHWWQTGDLMLVAISDGKSLDISTHWPPFALPLSTHWPPFTLLLSTHWPHFDLSLCWVYLLFDHTLIFKEHLAPGSAHHLISARVTRPTQSQSSVEARETNRWEWLGQIGWINCLQLPYLIPTVGLS